MADKLIEYDYQTSFEGLENRKLAENSENGLNWEWSISTAYSLSRPSWKLDIYVYFSWKFEWDEQEMLRMGGYGYEGFIDAFYVREGREIAIKYQVKLEYSGQVVSRRIGTVRETKLSTDSETRNFRMLLHLKPINFAPELQDYDDFAYPPYTDEWLIVNGVQFSVNKTYLSMQSQYFRELFRKSPPNQQEIFIEDVDSEEFKLLLELIHPRNPVFPTDDNVETLLQMADKFQVPSANCHISYFLANISELPFSTMLRLASQFMLRVYRQLIDIVDSMEVIKCVRESEDYEELGEWPREELNGKEAELKRRE